MNRLALTIPILLLVAATNGVPIQAGSWSVRTDITDLQMPGAPPMLAKLFAKRPQTWKGCVSQADAAKGPPLGTFARAGCTVTQTLSAKGVFTSHAVCPQPDGGTGTTDVSGTYTPTTFDAVARSVQTGKHPMTMSLKLTGQRTGGC
ncbi:DUF3617 domain-containing protein [Sphingomonas sp. RP10(2022)]|uniref:DUF3617 domain-containing protein n=1 Tax=Sphingomonas liriopis TaxID=2949094 RepID=A0A9X2HNZ2_9SPHN|nr:DUF3617 domain-containing protein [Sphingomonas liriopis]MCP3734656.1 DUF3617 domain-containing protein [Sphingomonas liriopis]